MNHDEACRAAITRSPGLMVPWFLMASYAYYHADESLLSDPLYDWIAKQLMERWDEIEHRHKRIIDRKALSAGTAYTIPLKKYPGITRSAAHRLIEELKA